MIDNNSEYVAIDVMAGDEEATEHSSFLQLTPHDVTTVLTKIMNNPRLSEVQKAALLKEPWRMNYVVKPPTPQEFISSKYLGSMYDDSKPMGGFYPHIIEAFYAFMDPAADKRVLALSTCIAYGKTTLSLLIAFYIIVCNHYMRDPKKYWDIKSHKPLSIVFLSFTKRKTDQIMVRPFENMMGSSPIFERVVKEERLQQKQKDIGPGKIAYTSAGKVGSFQLAKDIHIVSESKRENLLGMDILMGIASEISFWIEKGISIDEIWDTFTTLRDRIDSRFSKRYLTATILDSSPLDLQRSPIDKWIYSGEAEKDPSVMVVNKKHWEVFGDRPMYTEWKTTGATFPVFRGDSSRTPRVISDAEIKEYDQENIYHIPIDVKQMVTNNIKTFLRDYCAYPSGADNKLITNYKVIEDSFYESLKNVYSHIIAPASQMPNRLIWDKIVNKFFLQDQDKFQFYRYPSIPRYIHMDLAESKDSAGISMVHLETNGKGERVVVADFSFAIVPNKEHINLDAISNFIEDLHSIGNINIACVTADQWQSSAMKQRFVRQGINTEKFSADSSMDAYNLAVTLLMTGRLKCGHNIYLKNNWKSLVEVTYQSGYKKIDHIKAKQPSIDADDGWQSSVFGYGQKDVSDSLVSAIYLCYNREVSPYSYALWEETSTKGNLSVNAYMDKLLQRFALKPINTEPMS